MSRIKVSLGCTVSPKPYESKRYDLEVETETNANSSVALSKAFAKLRNELHRQMQIDKVVQDGNTTAP